MSYQNREHYIENIPQQNMQADSPLLIAVIFLVVIGLMSIFSASAPKCIEMGVDPTRFLIQQLMGVVAGIFGLKFLSNFHYKKLMTYTLPFAAIVIVMLILVKFVGVTVNGAQRWLNLGFTTIQPSEFAKPAVVLLLSGVFYRNSKKLVCSCFFHIFVVLMLSENYLARD